MICLPNNYAYPDQENLEYGILRITALAHNQKWFTLDEASYQEAKNSWYTILQKTALDILPSLKKSQTEFASETTAKDMFTPRTVHKFTGHINGAIYGCPTKVKNGQTHLDKFIHCWNGPRISWDYWCNAEWHFYDKFTLLTK